MHDRPPYRDDDGQNSARGLAFAMWWAAFVIVVLLAAIVSCARDAEAAPQWPPCGVVAEDFAPFASGFSFVVEIKPRAEVLAICPPRTNPTYPACTTWHELPGGIRYGHRVYLPDDVGGMCAARLLQHEMQHLKQGDWHIR